MNRREKAIEVIEHSRETHVKWIDFLSRFPKWYEQTERYVGDLDHHKRCVEGYDLVLAELRGET